ncbi:MAG: NAD(P)/FAD-dependent oxidoreductase [Clostridiales bacterium]|jgi:predicted Rossmann fold flavoprotein|nr:NAD(P)/FAD-dependent oxidoreductase [Clostridiales bacterium]
MRVAVIGGGASGTMAAGYLAERGAETVLFEKNEKLLKKLYITGKGRCNLTNSCTADEFLTNVVRGGRFLSSSLRGFSPSDTMSFFEEHGLPLKTERGNRVFPLSDKSSDVIKTLARYLDRGGVKVVLNAEIGGIDPRTEGGFWVKYGSEKLPFDAVIVATGGVSYPTTGSTGDGYRFAARTGHSLVERVPALCSVAVKEDIGELEGLSLKNVSAAAYADGKKLCSEFGEMLFTDDSLTGPIILSLSSRINRFAPEDLTVEVDLKPALTVEVLDDRILRDFQENLNRDFKNALDALLPQSLIGYVIRETKIPPNKKVNEIKKEERKALVKTLKGLTFHVKSLGAIENAIVTSGGIELSSVNPKTMESKVARGLYFVGEVLDIDALTGGFNLQLAFATGVAGAKGIISKVES